MAPPLIHLMSKVSRPNLEYTICTGPNVNDLHTHVSRTWLVRTRNNNPSDPSQVIPQSIFLEKPIWNIDRKVMTSLNHDKAPIFTNYEKLYDRKFNQGWPICRPIWWLDSQSAETYTIDDQFAIGNDILVAPFLEMGKTIRDIYLPSADDAVNTFWWCKMSKTEYIISLNFPLIDEDVSSYIFNVLKAGKHEFQDREDIFECLGEVLMDVTNGEKKRLKRHQMVLALMVIVLFPILLGEMLSNMTGNLEEYKKKMEKAEAKIKTKHDRRDAAEGTIVLLRDIKIDETGRCKDIRIENFDISFGNKLLLSEADLILSYGRRYGLVGRNGIGKSTLLKMISNGSLITPKHISVLHVEQEVVGNETTALDAVLECDLARASLLAEEKRLLAIKDGSEDVNAKLEKVYADLNATEADKSPARAASILTEYESQMDFRKHTQEFIDKFRYNAKRASLVQSKIKMLEKLPVLKPLEKEEKLVLKFPECEPLSGAPILQLDEVSFGWGDGEDVLHKISLNLQSRICIVGDNGSGKTTLLKLLIGDISPRSGERKAHRNLKIGYFSQHHIDQLTMGQSSIEFLAFSGDLGLQPIESLSGGQKSRVAFAVMALANPQLIILDEPTNHLDVETVEALGDAINKYNGGVMLVSHYETLIQMVCKELWLVKNKKVLSFEYGFEEYRLLIEKELEDVK
uniref:ABC transporter domain-containing protein n=1 Tax=Tetranychus urticae TaxID=32264 RepID=T1KGV6_TETUR